MERRWAATPIGHQDMPARRSTRTRSTRRRSRRATRFRATPTAIRTSPAPGPTRPTRRCAGRAANKNLVMTDAEAVKARARTTRRTSARRPTTTRSNPTACSTARTSLRAAATTPSGSIRATTTRMVKGTWRTSWIVDPPNGQMPMKSDGGGGGPPGGARRGNGYDNPEERNLNERCLILGTSGPPIGNYLYNNNLPHRAVAGRGGDRERDDPRRARRPLLERAKHKPTSAVTSGWATRSAGGKATRWWSRPST